MRIGGAVLVVAVAASSLRASAQIPIVGQAAPDFALELLGGGRASLAQFRGRPVLLNFWATWCKPCADELPAIVDAYHRHRESGLEVLAVNLSDQEQARDVRRFVAQLNLPFPVMLDEGGKARHRYHLIGIPTTVMIDSSGVVRAIYPGPINAQMLRQGLEQILPAPR